MMTRIYISLMLTSGIAGAQQPASITSDALSLLSDRALAVKNSFWIYTNGDDLAHGFPSGKFGGATGLSGPSLQRLFDQLEANTHCVYDPSSPTGCSTDTQRVDCQRGTVLSVKFPSLTGDQYLGLNIEEPEQFSTRTGTVGYDLRGSTRLVFEIATLSDAPVNLNVGIADSTQRQKIMRSDGWRSVTLNFGDLGLNASQLRDVHILFTLATNASLLPPGGAVVFVDNIRVEPVPDRQASALGLPGSTQTCGVVQRSAAPVPIDQQLVGVSTVYESSIAAIALANARPPGYKAALTSIADALAYAVNNDNSGLAIPPANDGSGARGIRSGYRKGELPLNNAQPSPLLGRLGQTQLAGFSVAADTLCGPSRYCLVTDEVTGGNSAFAIIALLHAAREIGSTSYIDAARSIGRWVAANLRDDQGYGGFFNGYRNPGPNDADKARKILDRGKSIENAADLAAAYSYLADMERQKGDAVAASRWTELSTHAADFVFALFTESEGRFYAGTVQTAQVFAGIEPDCGSVKKGLDCLNRADFLDSNTFTTLALATRPEYTARIDWRRPIRWVLANQRKTVRANGFDFTGFSLVKQPVLGPDGIAWEFTGQVALALKVLESLYPGEGFGEQARFYVDQLRNAKANAPFTDRRGIPAATLPDGNAIIGLRTPFQEIPQRVNIAASAFGIFSEGNINPLAVPARFTADRVVNSASFAAPPDNGVSPGSYFTIFGANLAREQSTLTELVNGKLPFVLGGTGVLVNGQCAPVTFVSPGQINAQAPVGLTNPTVLIEVRTAASSNDCLTGSPGLAMTVPQRAISPAFFVYPDNSAIALHEDGTSLVNNQAPARPGEVIVLFGTGWGTTEKALQEGEIPTGINRIVSTVNLSVAGSALPSSAVLYAGLAPSFPGLYQLNVQLPMSVPNGNAALRLCIADSCSQQTVTVAVAP